MSRLRLCNGLNWADMSGMLGESSQSLPILAPLWHFNERCTVISSSLSIGQSKTGVHYFIACRWEQQIAWQYDDDYDDNDDYDDDDDVMMMMIMMMMMMMIMTMTIMTITMMIRITTIIQ